MRDGAGGRIGKHGLNSNVDSSRVHCLRAAPFWIAHIEKSIEPQARAKTSFAREERAIRLTLRSLAGRENRKRVRSGLRNDDRPGLLKVAVKVPLHWSQLLELDFALVYNATKLSVFEAPKT